MRTVASWEPALNDDDFLGSQSLAPYVREQPTQVALLVERGDNDAQTL
jgi:hypothetical protein